MPEWVDSFVRLEKHIVAALKYSQGTHEIQDVADQIAIGDLQLWSGKDTVAITQLIAYPRKKVLHVFLAGGTQAELKQMEPYVVEWAKNQGCTSITSTGRMGWAKSEMRSIGYRPTHVMISKDI